MVAIADHRQVFPDAILCILHSRVRHGSKELQYCIARRRLNVSTVNQVRRTKPSDSLSIRGWTEFNLCHQRDSLIQDHCAVRVGCDHCRDEFVDKPIPLHIDLHLDLVELTCVRLVRLVVACQVNDGRFVVCAERAFGLRRVGIHHILCMSLSVHVDHGCVVDGRVTYL